MSSIIDTTYFQDQIAIAQKTDISVLTTLQHMIDYYEEEFLIKLLSYQLKQAIGTSGTRWTDILNGKDYVYGVQTRRWRGLKFTQGGINKSPIANFIYCEWTKKEVSATTGSGEKKISSKIAIDNNPSQKICRAWNEMVHWNQGLFEFLQINHLDYPEWLWDPGNELFHTINPWGL